MKAGHTARTVARGMTDASRRTGSAHAPGEDLRFGAIEENDPSNEVELPQRHRRVAFPPDVVRALACAPAVADRDPGAPSFATAPPHRAGQPGELIDDAVGAPAEVLAADLLRPRLHLRRRLVRARLGARRTNDQSGQTVRGTPGAPGGHRLVRNPELGGLRRPCVRRTAQPARRGTAARQRHVHQGPSRPPTTASTRTRSRKVDQTRASSIR
ncbi:MAG: hypothetical protein JWR81_1975 [Pseudonocardia sp.]|jgi:hypothetical protein|nr:hypothetical protein [Pseudonocardia sp.]